MKTKSLFLRIPEPCHEDWQAMLPQEKGRHCLACQKTVTDFTKMSDREIIDFFEKKQKRRQTDCEFARLSYPAGSDKICCCPHDQNETRTAYPDGGCICCTTFFQPTVRQALHTNRCGDQMLGITKLLNTFAATGI